MLTSLAAGFALGLSLILAIGAQNAFVLRQGLRREHVFWVCPRWNAVRRPYLQYMEKVLASAVRKRPHTEPHLRAMCARKCLWECVCTMIYAVYCSIALNILYL